MSPAPTSTGSPEAKLQTGNQLITRLKRNSNVNGTPAQKCHLSCIYLFAFSQLALASREFRVQHSFPLEAEDHSIDDIESEQYQHQQYNLGAACRNAKLPHTLPDQYPDREGDPRTHHL